MIRVGIGAVLIGALVVSACDGTNAPISPAGAKTCRREVLDGLPCIVCYVSLSGHFAAADIPSISCDFHPEGGR